MKTKLFSTLLAFLLAFSMIFSMVLTTVHAYDPEDCPHANAYFTEDTGEPSCFEPAMGGYWYCEDCWTYYDADMQNMYWDENEMFSALKKPATGHAFNNDTGKCDNCGISNPVYTKITSLSDVNEEDMYIIVANVGDRYFVLGGLNVNESDPMGNAWCYESGNAVEVVPYEDGSISLLNQNYVGNARPSEFMFDIDPEQFNSDLDDNFGLTPIIPKLDNYCVYPFQSYSLDNTGYMGVPRYGNDVYGMWDSSEWIIDFYTTEVDENTYRDDMDGLTHAEQVARGNIGENISEGDLLLYKASFYSVGGAMFTLRFREYPNPETGTTEYYFICGEDWALEGSPGWDHITDTTPTNDTQYSISLYRYDIPSAPAHTCDFGNWTDNGDGTHIRTCKDATCGEAETKPHGFDGGVETKAPTCIESGITTYTCTDCNYKKTENINATDHKFGDWTSVDEHSHKHSCTDCSASETDTHSFDEGVVTKAPTINEEGIRTYTCSVCNYKKTESIDKVDHAHNWTDWAEDGENHTHSCKNSDCGIRESLPHEWIGGTQTKDPTCTEPGEMTYTCKDCDAKKTEAVESQGHTWTDWEPDGDVNHSRYCMSEICDAKESDPHVLDSGEITKEPTETEEGVKTYSCQTCWYTKEESIPKIVTIVENLEAGVTLDVMENSNVFIPVGTVIDVVEKPTEEIPDEVLGEIAVTADGAAKPLGIYDLSLLLDGAEIQPGGTVVVTLPAPDLAAEYDSVIVVYIAPDGSYEECKTTVNEDGTISFETDHFSRYAIIGIDKSEGKGGLSTGAIVAIVIGAVILLGAGGFAIVWFVIKKKSLADLLAIVKNTAATKTDG